MIKLPKFSQWSRRERLLAVGSAAFLVFLLVDRTVVTSWGQHLVTMNRQIRDLEHGLANQYRLLARKEGIQQEVRRYEKYLRPGGDKELYTATLLKEIDELAKQSQVTLEEVKPLLGVENELFQEYSFEVHSECPLPQWVRFVHLIETSHSLFEIEKAKVGVKEGKQDLLEGTLLLRTISMRDSADAGPKH